MTREPESIMKTTFSATVGLPVAILLLHVHCSIQAIADDSTFTTLAAGADTYSDPISTNGSFNFGYSSVDTVYVSSNGYISMGVPATETDPVIPGSLPMVAPYAANIDRNISGRVRYTQFTTDNEPTMTTISGFIREHTDDNDFYGTKMMAAEWSNVAKFGGSAANTSTFEAVLITDGSASYAVFFYECDGMGWDGAAIGWQAENAVPYESYHLIGPTSSDVCCENQQSCEANNYNEIVFRVDQDRGPVPGDCRELFMCDNGQCVPPYLLCDGPDHCGDNSDEVGCGCEQGEFRCDNAVCVPQSDVCDQEDDCGDHSDEEQACPVPIPTSGSCDGYFCNSGECISYEKACDGDYDCEDGSDEFEEYCSSPTESDITGCRANQFSCDNGLCVLRRYVCDQIDDCGDNSDEEQGCGFTCDNGICISDDYECDGTDDCDDNSDEEDCSSSQHSVDIGLALGLSLGLVYPLICGGILALVIVVVVYVAYKKRHQGAVDTRVTTTQSSTGGTRSSVPFQKLTVRENSDLTVQDTPPTYTQNKYQQQAELQPIADQTHSGTGYQPTATAPTPL